MMEYFDKDGHLTEYAFALLQKDDTDLETRFEISEHLSFCDMCLERYTAYLTDDKLIENIPSGISENVFKKIKYRAKKLLFNKYSTVAIAAAISLTIWGGNTLNTVYEFSAKLYTADIKKIVTEQYEKTEKVIEDKLEKLINNIFDKEKEL